MTKQSKKSKVSSNGGYRHTDMDTLIKMGAFISQGKSISYIADKLDISTSTVSNRRDEAIEMYQVEGEEVIEKAKLNSLDIIRRADRVTRNKIQKADPKKAAEISKIHFERYQTLSDSPTEIINANVTVENERPSLTRKAFDILVGPRKKKTDKAASSK